MASLSKIFRKILNIFLAFVHKVGIIIPTTLIILVLKLAGVLPWSWLVVFSPILIYLAFIVWVFISVFINTFIRNILEDARSMEDEENK